MLQLFLSVCSRMINLNCLYQIQKCPQIKKPQETTTTHHPDKNEGYLSKKKKLGAGEGVPLLQLLAHKKVPLFSSCITRAPA